jgi:integrase
MPALKLTKRTVDALLPGDRPYLARDTDLKGFACRIGASGSKSWVVAYRPAPGGRGVREKVITLGSISTLTPDQARRAAAEMLARVRLGEDPGADRSEKRKALTLGELLDFFDQQHVALFVKPTTAVSHRLALDVLRGAHGSSKAESVTRAQVASLHARLSDRPYTANRHLAVWAKAFSWAGKRGIISGNHNPAKGIERYREQGRERFLTSDELARLGAALVEGQTLGLLYHVDESGPKAKHAPKPENRRVKLDPFAVAAIRLLIFTGARLREILHAKWEQVDFNRGMIFLPDSKTGKKPIYLSAAALAILAELPRIRGNQHIIAGAGESPRADLKKPWRAVTRAAGLEGLRLHDLRHSFASVGVGASLGLPIVGKLLGHTQASTTQRYAHLDADPLRRAVDVIGDTIAAAMNGGGDDKIA